MKKILTLGIMFATTVGMSHAQGVDRLEFAEKYIYANSNGVFRYSIDSGKDISDPDSWEPVAFESKRILNYAVDGENIIALTQKQDVDSSNGLPGYGYIHNIILNSDGSELNVDEFIKDSPYYSANQKYNYYSFLAQRPGHPEELTLTSGIFLLRSEDFGKTWRVLPEIVYEATDTKKSYFLAAGLTYHPYLDNCLMAWNDAYIYYSMSGGETTDSYTTHKFDNRHNLTELSFSAQDPDVMIFSGLSNGGAGTYPWLTRTTDFWETAESDLIELDGEYFERNACSVAFDPENIGTAYMYLNNLAATDEDIKEALIMKTTDNGVTWKKFASVDCDIVSSHIATQIKDGILYVLLPTYTKPVVYAYNLNELAGIGNVAEKIPACETEDVYSIDGLRVLRATSHDAIKNLPAGIYICDGKKFIVR